MWWVDCINQTKALVRGYFHEALWLNNGYVPTLEEYLKVSVITSGYFYMTAASYVGMGEEATKEVFDWLKTHPKFVMDSSLIGRLVDDIQSHEVKLNEYFYPYCSKIRLTQVTRKGTEE